MTNTRGKKLSPRAALDLLSRVPHRVDPEMSRELMGTLYVLQDGGAVFMDVDGRGLHFYSFDELVARYRTNVKHALDRKDDLTKLLPHGEQFLTDVPSLVAELPRFLDIDSAVLNLSEESLEAVDSAIRRLGSERILTPEVFPSLTAYVGEVIRRQVNGSWEVRTTREGTRHEPDIVDPTGGRYGLLRIYKQFLEYGRTASMRTFVHAALRTYRLLPPH